MISKRVETGIWTAALLGCYLIWWAAFFPAAMCKDSISEWTQNGFQGIDNWHPFLHTVFLQLSKLLAGSPWPFALCQILSTIGLFSYASSLASRYGGSQKIIRGLGLYLLLLPSIGIYNVWVGKDTSYAQALCLLILSFTEYLKGERGLRVSLQIIAACVLSASLRHNGALVIVWCVAVAFLFKHTGFKKLLIGIIGSYCFVHLFLAGILSVQDPDRALFGASRELQFIGAFLHNGGELSEKDQSTVNQIVPVEDLKRLYSCIEFDGLPQQASYFHGDRLQNPQLASALHEVFYSTLPEMVPFIIADRACMFANMLGLGPVELSYPYESRIMRNSEGLLQTDPLGIKTYLDKYLASSKAGILRFLCWSAVPALAILIVLFLGNLWTQNVTLLAMYLIFILDLGAVFLFENASHFRYCFALIFNLPFLVVITTLFDGKNQSS